MHELFGSRFRRLRTSLVLMTASTTLKKTTALPGSNKKYITTLAEDLDPNTVLTPKSVNRPKS